MNYKALLLFAILAIAGVLLAGIVAADPVNPTTVTSGTSSRGNVDGTSQNASAQAGNVTRLDISAYQLTKSWQGYFGNLTGDLLLSDGSNNRLYNWSLTSPSGEVYASRNSSITWATVNCSNSTQVTLEETALGHSASDGDSVTNTFGSTSHPWFLLGSNNITGCKSVTLNNASGEQTSMFWNVLLSDNADSTVYTTILENGASGFNAEAVDFELIVGEDGHGDAASSVTPYYFWVELS
ncbi:MAG: hypothetical protein V1725_03625 [archaeon]